MRQCYLKRSSRESAMDGLYCYTLDSVIWMRVVMDLIQADVLLYKVYLMSSLPLLEKVRRPQTG